jgi:preprotein translocase subunit SecA
VTISTNMAGRGTDIWLGGNPEMLALAKCGGDRNHPEYAETFARFEDQCSEERVEVVEAGGLHILGTERHESRRVDNQLRGRSGRQGDPGSSQFFLSLEDDLLRIFEADRVKQWWDRVGVEEGEAIENRLLTRVIENAQKKVEARNFDIRKHLLEYDNTMNSQRQAFYARRSEAMEQDPHAEILDMTEGAIVTLLDAYGPSAAGSSPGARRSREGAHRAVRRPVRRERAPFPEGGESRPIARRSARRCSTASPRSSRARRRSAIGSPRSMRPRATRTSASASGRSCCRSSTRSGRITCTRWTACARASTCARTDRKIRSSNIGARDSACSRR